MHLPVNSMWLAEAPAATVPNMNNENRIALDGEQYPVLMRAVATEKLANLKRELTVLRRQRTAFGHLGERVYSVFQFSEPPQSRVACLPCKQPLQDDV